ncbi:MAG TPA: imidazole glycerol phosphate synthase subunit HisH [Chloroflexota bacterium]|nr:imidazole glycerol phosphate synthase subunit HisH [Chloroflexota bacterium]
MAAYSVPPDLSALRPVVVDYGAGNLRSVVRAFRAIGAQPSITDDPAAVADAHILVLPGVGAAGQIMGSLQRLELDEAICAYIQAGRPYLGVCMGMQVLMERSEEGGGQECLGIFPGSVARLETSLKVPHMGWNVVHQEAPHPVWEDVPDDSYFYFVHSYAVRPTDASVILATTDYDGVFPSAIGRANVFGTQFHPEKSGRHGLRIYRNFLRWAAQW